MKKEKARDMSCILKSFMWSIIKVSILIYRNADWSMFIVLASNNLELCQCKICEVFNIRRWLYRGIVLPKRLMIRHFYTWRLARTCTYTIYI